MTSSFFWSGFLGGILGVVLGAWILVRLGFADDVLFGFALGAWHMLLGMVFALAIAQTVVRLMARRNS